MTSGTGRAGNAVVLAIILLPLMGVPVALGQATGTNGVNGTPGTNGTPTPLAPPPPVTYGSAGTNGTDTTAPAPFTAMGGTGGKGALGASAGAGANAATANAFKDGTAARGGDGGSGGTATATGTSAAAAGVATATATGGAPGGGGNGGVGIAATPTTTGTVGGRGGNAGANTTPAAGVMGMTGNGSATASITTTGGASSTAMATGGGSTKTAPVAGGNGGNAPIIAGNGGNGTDGGTAVATADTMAAGATSSATAIGGGGAGGGNGGNAPPNPKDDLLPTFGGDGGFAGDGGGAMANATTANGTSATANATGGNGGFAGFGGTGHQVPGPKVGKLLPVGGPGDDGIAGQGGHAVADASSTNKAGNTTATANSVGGNGGVLGPKGVAVIGKPGSALARATANASGNATADPTATIGKGTGGIAVAVGNATGNGGKTTDNGFGISDGKTRKVNGRAIANIPAGAMGNVQGQGQAAIAASLPALTPNTTLNAFGSAIAQPLIADVLGTSATAPKVVSALEVGGIDGDQLGLVSLGGLYPTSGSGATASFTGSAAFSFDPKELPGQYLLVGLQNGLASGSGFDSLDFQILVDNTPIVLRDFTSQSAALNYFDDNILDLGALAGLPLDSNGLLDIQFDLTLTANTPGDGFAVNLAFADVPEPDSLGLLGPAVAAILALSWAHGRRRHPG